MSILELTPQEKTKRKTLVRIASIIGPLILIFGGRYVYTGVTTQSWYHFLVAGSFFTALSVCFLIFRSRHEEEPKVGAWHLLLAFAFVSIITTPITNTSTGEIIFLRLAIMLVLVIQTLPTRNFLRGTILASVTAIAASFVSFYLPALNLGDATTIDPVATWVIRFLTLVFFVYIMLQFRKLNMTSRLLISFLAVAVIVSFTFSIVISLTASRTMTTQVGRGIQALAESRGTLIGDYLYGQVESLQTFALDETIRQSVRQANALKPNLDSIMALDEQWQQSVASGTVNSLINSRMSNSLSNDLRAFQSLAPENVEVFVTDKAGAIVSTTNPIPDYYQGDEDWWRYTYKTGEGNIYIGQPEFSESVGELVIPIAVPIYDTRLGGLIGIMGTSISMQGLLGVLDEPIGETGEVDIIFTGNPSMQLHDGKLEDVEHQVLTHIEQLEQTDQYFITTVYEGNNSIFTSSTVNTLANNPEVNELNWKAVIHQQESEALAPVQEQIRLTNFFGTLLAGATVLLGYLFSQRLTNPIINLTDTAKAISDGNLSVRATVESEDEIGQLAETFNMMTTQLREMLTGLEERVAERTAELEESSKHLEKRAEQFEAIAQLARTITSIQDLESLLPRIAQMVSEHFGFYHVGLFLLDESRQYALLSAANSEGGQKMLARKHRLGVGQTGIVGYVTETGNPRIALDTGTDAVFFDNPDLPETRSEMALPLRVGTTIIGALDVQSTEQNAFSEDDVEVLSILADEVSIAIQNARLFEESQRVLAEAQSAYSDFTQEAWQKLSRSRETVGYELSGTTIRSLEEPAKGNGSSIAVPIKLRDQVIGTMNISLPENKKMEPDEVDITEAIAQRVGVAIESATLLEESQKSAMKEQVISEITGKIGSSINMRNVLQTAVEELGRALPGSEVIIQFTDKNESGGSK